MSIHIVSLWIKAFLFSLATSVLDCIKQRRLDVFFELEEKIMSGAALDKSLMEVQCSRH